MQRRREPRGRRRLIGGLAFAAAFGIGLVAGSADATFWLGLVDDREQRIDHITVFGHTRVSAEAIAASLGIEPGTDASEIDLAVAAERVRQQPWVRNASVHRASGGLLVQIEERSPAALLHAGGDDGWRGVEADGTPFAELDPAQHPDLVRLLAETPRADGAPEPHVAQALELARSIAAHGLPMPTAIALPAEGDDPQRRALGWRFQLADGGPEVVLGREPGADRLRRLAKLLAAQPEAVRAAERIDLRFRDRAILSAIETVPAEDGPVSHDANAGSLTARLEGGPASG